MSAVESGRQWLRRAQYHLHRCLIWFYYT